MSEIEENQAPKKTSFFSRLTSAKQGRAPEAMSVDAWLDLCRTDPGAYANAADRITKAIGDATIVDTKHSEKQERIVFGQKKIARYDAFSELYDKEDEISDVVAYIKSGATGLLVLRGPVGSGKTEIATVLEKLAEKQPMYLLKCKVTGEISPFNDTPLCLLSDDSHADAASEEYGIPRRYLEEIKSKWVTKRLEQHDYDVDAAFEVVKIYPSRENQRGIAKLDPKSKQSPDIHALIGERDINKIGEEDKLDPTGERTLSAGDPDAYLPGAFSKSHGGVFHGAEFFRNNPDMLNMFLEAVTTGYFTGDAGVGMLPMNQLIVLTTNDPVWQEILRSADSDALRDRAHVVDIGYTLRMSEEKKIYEKLMKKHGLEDKPIAPKTLDLLAEFAVVTRLKDGKDGALAQYDRHVRAKVHNGETPDGEGVPKIDTLRQKASSNEGLEGFSIRDAERVLKACFNARANEGIEEADTILMIEAIRDFIKAADESTIASSDRPVYEEAINTIADRYKTEIQKTINTAIVDADDGNCQVQFEKYLHYAQAYLDEEIITEHGEEIKLPAIERHLSTMEKKAGITQPEEFRRSVVEAVNRELARIARENSGKKPEDQIPAIVHWKTYEPLKEVIEAQHEADIESRRHILKARSESDLRTEEEKRQYSRFYDNMHSQGYTDTMVNRMLMELT